MYAPVNRSFTVKKKVVRGCNGLHGRVILVIHILVIGPNNYHECEILAMLKVTFACRFSGCVQVWDSPKKYAVKNRAGENILRFVS